MDVTAFEYWHILWESRQVTVIESHERRSFGNKVVSILDLEWNQELIHPRSNLWSQKGAEME